MPDNPTLAGSIDTGDARDVAVNGGFAYVADFSNSLRAVDLADPANPLITGSTPLTLGGRLHDITVVGGFAFGADVLFVNGVPIVDVRAPATPIATAILDFRNFRDDNGTGIAADSSYVYLTAARTIQENGTTGTTRLYIGQYLNVDDTAGQPPTVAITAPLPGTEVIEGTTFQVTVDAQDDFAVQQVDFLIDGQVVASDPGAPHEASVTAPAVLGALTVGARAVDTAGNAATAEVTITVIPDPGTTVEGLVVLPDGVPAVGAVVTVFELNATTDGAGAFSIGDVPTLRGAISATATLEIDGARLFGRSRSEAPVPDGTTDVGTIILSEAQFDEDFGTNLNQSDDDSDQVVFSMAFTFPFFGVEQTAVFVNSNGNLTFGGGNTTFNPPIPGGVVSGRARISPLFTDINPSAATVPGAGVYVNQHPERLVVTWNRLPQFGEAGDNTFQAILFSDGRIQLGYDGLSADGFGNGFGNDALDISVAVSGGGFPALRTVDYTADTPFGSVAGDGTAAGCQTQTVSDAEGDFRMEGVLVGAFLRVQAIEDGAEVGSGEVWIRQEGEEVELLVGPQPEPVETKD